MTALNTTLRLLADPERVQKLMNRAVRFAMIIQYYKIKPGKTVTIKR